MADSVELHGHCDEGFSRVRDQFRRGFESGAEVGASLCVEIDGEPVVDLWAGHADGAKTRPWKRDTLANVYSTTKGITAIAAHRLVDQGRLDLDAPVADYWPEFAAAGKATLPVHMLLSHRAGLAAVRAPLAKDSLYDWDTMTAALAAQEPWWEPGTAHGYHAVTFGFLVGEVVRRITGQSVGEYVRSEIAGPLGVEFEIGFGPELDPRVADLVQGPVHPNDGGFDLAGAVVNDPEGVLAKAFANPPLALLGVSVPNSRDWRAAEIPAANGHSNAHSLARIYGTLASGGERDGYRLLGPDTIDRGRSEQAHGRDAVLPLETRVSLGFFLSTEDEPLAGGPRAFGHGGAGGSYSYADPERGVGFGYVMNCMHTGTWIVDPRPRALLDEVYAALDS